MSKIMQQLESEMTQRAVPDFSPGDTVVVQVRVKEGNRERLQAYEGVVIARRNRGVNSSFTVRKISFGEGVERVFPLYSPGIWEIEVVRKGVVRRAKLYYLRDLRGKASRIAEDVEAQRELVAEQADEGRVGGLERKPGRAKLTAEHPQAHEGPERDQRAERRDLEAADAEEHWIHVSCQLSAISYQLPLLRQRAHNSTRRKRSALPITDTELNVIAALAQIGLMSRPMNG